MHSIVTTFRGANIKVEVANFCAAMDTSIDQDVYQFVFTHCYFVTTKKVGEYGYLSCYGQLVLDIAT